MTGCYGDVTQFNNDECSWLLQELYRLEEEADQKPKKWEHHWHKLSYPAAKRTVRNVDFRTEKCNLFLLLSSFHEQIALVLCFYIMHR